MNQKAHIACDLSFTKIESSEGHRQSRTLQ